jgi:hypothetical protein
MNIGMCFICQLCLASNKITDVLTVRSFLYLNTKPLLTFVCFSVRVMDFFFFAGEIVQAEVRWSQP